MLRDKTKENPNFITENLNDICASIQNTVVEILMNKLKKASIDFKINQIALAGGVSANSALRQAFYDYEKKYSWKVFIPPFEFTTDNAAMIAITGHFKYLDNQFCKMTEVPYSRVTNQF
jgi:N6-L-threonylcarbamoyladenine synthase